MTGATDLQGRLPACEGVLQEVAPVELVSRVQVAPLAGLLGSVVAQGEQATGQQMALLLCLLVKSKHNCQQCTMRTRQQSGCDICRVPQHLFCTL